MQAQLARTIRYNPEHIAAYQPVHGIHHVPPPPVSSLNSIASTSHGNHTSSIHPFPPHPSIRSERVVRPQCTPVHSYRGFQPSTAQRVGHDMDVEQGYASGIAPQNVNFVRSGGESQPDYAGGLSTASWSHDERSREDDFTAFSSDAFAPLCSENPQRSTDIWGKTRGQGSFTRGQRNDMRDNGITEQTQMQAQQLDRSRSGSPMSTEVTPDPDGNWSGRLRDTKARSKRRSPNGYES
jgi:hypothetical protein